MTYITITKVVSKSFITDFIENIRNFLGKNLVLYEAMVDKGIKQVQEELTRKNIKLKWYRYEITQLTNGAIVIMLYGET